MGIDPSFGRPFERFGQVGSFIAPMLPPLVGPGDAPLTFLPCINQEWLRLLMGAASQLANPSSWAESVNDSGRLLAVQRAQELMTMLGQWGTCVNPVIGASLDNCILNLHLADGTTIAVTNWAAQFPGCVRANIPPPPTNPRGIPVDQNACNLAGYLASKAIQGAVQIAYNDFNAGHAIEQFANDLLPFLASVGFFYTAAFADAALALFGPITVGNQADFQAAATDAALKAELTCAIFLAIRGAGSVTDANFPTIVANIAAISYTHPEVISAIANYVSSLGSIGLRSLEVVGALDDEDCSTCGDTWCYEWVDPQSNPSAPGIDTPPWQKVPGDANTDPAGVFTVAPPFILSKSYGGSEQLHVYYPFHPTFVSSIDVNYTTRSVKGAASRVLGTSATTNNLAGTGINSYGDHVVINAVVSYVYVLIDSTLGGGLRNQLDALTIRGTGANPIGPNVCT